MGAYGAMGSSGNWGAWAAQAQYPGVVDFARMGGTLSGWGVGTSPKFRRSILGRKQAEFGKSDVEWRMSNMV